MQFPAPPLPALPPEQLATVAGALRYEDLTMDGRLIPIGVPPALGGLWRALLTHHAGARAAHMSGVIPLLTRITIASHDQPIRVDRPIESRGGFELAHDRDAAGDVSRIYLNMWCDVYGAAGRLFPPQSAGPLALAGQMFAEHVFTRPFAPPAQRKVTRLAVEGYPDLPPTRHAAPPPASAMDMPAGARWLDELAADSAEVCFTLDQTDSNQHVNSIVYLRVFGDAVQRRLAAGGHPLRVRTTALDIAYRKPCFAGDRVRAHLRMFELDGTAAPSGGAAGRGQAPIGGGTLGAAGYIAAAGDDKPRCYVRVFVGA